MRNILLGAAIVVILFAIIATRSCIKHKEQVATITNIGAQVKDATRHYTDTYGTDHGQKDVQQGNIDALRVFYADKIDSLCKRLNIKQKQLQDMADVIAESNGHGETSVRVIRITDTIPGLPAGFQGKGFTYTDTGVVISGYIQEDSTIYPDSLKAICIYSVSLPISTTIYWRRKHSFLKLFRWGKKKYTVDAFSENRNVTIKSITAIKVEKK